MSPVMLLRLKVIRIKLLNKSEIRKMLIILQGLKLIASILIHVNRTDSVLYTQFVKAECLYKSFTIKENILRRKMIQKTPDSIFFILRV